ncbi:MAG: N-acyl-D-amino-acid deacylase family protein [Gemmatimonadaceae bacterium]
MSRLLPLVIVAAACARPAPVGTAPGAPLYDLVLAGGTVVDGSGAARYAANVAIRGDRIALVSRDSIPATASRRTIDASGLIIAPGFIDLHAHLEPLLRQPDAESHVRQGVTTALGGPDGGGPWPFASYLDSAQTLGVGMNVAFLAGHNTIRRRVMQLADRAPTADELDRMRGMLAQAMHEGAFGLSTGLRYLPGTFSKTDEVVALAKVSADSGGIYTSHLREEGLGLIEGVAEAIEIGRRAGITVVLTHHKAIGKQMWGQSARTLAMVDSARRAGIDVRMDQYPYTATSTGIGVLVPTWALAGGDSAFRRRLVDSTLRDSIVRGIVTLLNTDRGGGDISRVQFASVSWQRPLEGRTLRDWAVERGLAATPETGAELVIEAVNRGGASAIYHVLDEGDVERIMRHPQTMIASDGRLSRPGTGHPHPRGYGTFPRVLGRYVREKQVLTLEQAIHKMSGMPAATLRLADRGGVAQGLKADIVVFDADSVADRATFEEPHQYPAGIPYVIVNGVVAVDGGRFTGARGGRVLRRGQP